MSNFLNLFPPYALFPVQLVELFMCLLWEGSNTLPGQKLITNHKMGKIMEYIVVSFH